MQLSKTFDYAIRSMVHLASARDGHGADLKAISVAQNVPVSYLAKVMRTLVRGGLVTSTLGREGGYSLRKAPSEITLLQIYLVMEGELRLVECMDSHRNCALSNGCTQAGVWKRLTEAVEGIFRETTLADLLAPAGTPLPLTIKENGYARTSP